MARAKRASGTGGSIQAGTTQDGPVHAETILAINAPAPSRDNPLTRSPAGVAGLAFLGLMLVACLGSLFWTLRPVAVGEGEQAATVPRYNAGSPAQGRLPPAWWGYDAVARQRAMAAVPGDVAADLAREVAQGQGVPVERVLDPGPVDAALAGAYERALLDAAPKYVMGSDPLGRSLWLRVLTGGGISLTIGIVAALISVAIGTAYGLVAGYAGGWLDGLMMRIVDVLYGLPYILLVVLLAVASDAMVREHITQQKARARWVEATAQRVEVARQEGQDAALAVVRGPIGVMLAAGGGDGGDAAVREYLDGWEGRPAEELARELGPWAVPPNQLAPWAITLLDVLTLVVAIAAVSWLTMARVVRGQVLSLKGQPFVEAARAMGSPTRRIFRRHLLPNLVGPIVVYATLAVPQAILQESFLSFLGIGVRPPLPSWGNLAAEGLGEVNTYRSHWWLLVFPCVLLGLTLLALNFVGEGLREAMDPKRARRR